MAARQECPSKGFLGVAAARTPIRKTQSPGIRPHAWGLIRDGREACSSTSPSPLEVFSSPVNALALARKHTEKWAPAARPPNHGQQQQEGPGPCNKRPSNLVYRGRLRRCWLGVKLSHPADMDFEAAGEGLLVSVHHRVVSTLQASLAAAHSAGSSSSSFHMPLVAHSTAFKGCYHVVAQVVMQLPDDLEFQEQLPVQLEALGQQMHAQQAEQHLMQQAQQHLQEQLAGVLPEGWEAQAVQGGHAGLAGQAGVQLGGAEVGLSGEANSGFPVRATASSSAWVVDDMPAGMFISPVSLPCSGAGASSCGAASSSGSGSTSATAATAAATAGKGVAAHAGPSSRDRASRAGNGCGEAAHSDLTGLAPTHSASLHIPVSVLQRLQGQGNNYLRVVVGKEGGSGLGEGAPAFDGSWQLEQLADKEAEAVVELALDLELPQVEQVGWLAAVVMAGGSKDMASSRLLLRAEAADQEWEEVQEQGGEERPEAVLTTLALPLLPLGACQELEGLMAGAKGWGLDEAQAYEMVVAPVVQDLLFVMSNCRSAARAVHAKQLLSSIVTSLKAYFELHGMGECCRLVTTGFSQWEEMAELKAAIRGEQQQQESPMQLDKQPRKQLQGSVGKGEIADQQGLVARAWRAVEGWAMAGAEAARAVVTAGRKA